MDVIKIAIADVLLIAEKGNRLINAVEIIANDVNIENLSHSMPLLSSAVKDISEIDKDLSELEQKWERELVDIGNNIQNRQLEIGEDEKEERLYKKEAEETKEKHDFASRELERLSRELQQKQNELNEETKKINEAINNSNNFFTNIARGAASIFGDELGVDRMIRSMKEHADLLRNQFNQKIGTRQDLARKIQSCDELAVKQRKKIEQKHEEINRLKRLQLKMEEIKCYVIEMVRFFTDADSCVTVFNEQLQDHCKVGVSSHIMEKKTKNAHETFKQTWEEIAAHKAYYFLTNTSQCVNEILEC